MFKPANEVRVGDRLLAQDLMLWRVDRIERKGSMVDITINPVESGMLICKPTPDQVKRFKTTTRIQVPDNDSDSDEA